MLDFITILRLPLLLLNRENTKSLQYQQTYKSTEKQCKTLANHHRRQTIVVTVYFSPNCFDKMEIFRFMNFMENFIVTPVDKYKQKTMRILDQYPINCKIDKNIVNYYSQNLIFAKCKTIESH